MQTLPNGVNITAENVITGTSKNDNLYLDSYANNLNPAYSSVTIYGRDGDDRFDGANVFLNGKNVYSPGTLIYGDFYGEGGDDFFVGRPGGTTQAHGGSGFDEFLTDTDDFITTHMQFSNEVDRIVFERPKENGYAKFIIHNDIELLKDFGGNYLIVEDLFKGVVRYIDSDQAYAYRQSWKEGESVTLPESTPIRDPEPAPKSEPSPTGEPPNLIKATLRGKDITLQFDNIIADTLPSIGRFTLNQGNREYLVVDTEVRASEGIVTLTAEKDLDPTVALTLDYLDFAGDQALGVIESTTGVDLDSFTGFALNNQGSQVNSLTIDEGEFEGNQITLFLSAPISDAIPSKRRFKVKSANKKQKILDVSTESDDGIIVLTTRKSLDLQKSLFVSYRDLGGDQVTGVVEDLAGNDMERSLILKLHQEAMMRWLRRLHQRHWMKTHYQ